MNTAAEALAAIITEASIMSTESKRTQGRRTYSRKFLDASARHMAACMWLQANARGAWEFITADNHVSTDAARALLAAQATVAA